MNIINPSPTTPITSPDIILKQLNQTIKVSGTVYKVRRASGIVFVMLTHHKYTYQAVYISELCKRDLREICEGAKISITATVKEEERAEYGFELTMLDFEILNQPVAEYPVDITQPSLMCTLAENIENRTATLYHPKSRGVMTIMSELRRGYRKAMEELQFTEVATPKLSPITPSVENEYIHLRYFGKDATLTRDPMHYLEMALSVFTRVYELSPCFSGVNRNSTRHLNEYTSLAFSMAYDCDIETLMSQTMKVIEDGMRALSGNCPKELELLDIKVPCNFSTPVLTFAEAKTITKSPTDADIDPTDEAKLWDFAKEKHNSDFIFITHLPKGKWDFNTLNTENFILIYKGVTIARGCENVSSYDELLENMKERGINPEDYKGYVESYKYAMPPHGGVKIGMERLVYKLCDLSNIREATLFTRDLHHLEP